MKVNVKTLVKGGFIAAIYAALTYAAAAMNLAYGGIQFRFSEALNILPVFTPAAIPGLTLGCFISNLTSPYPLDMLFGTLATLLGGIFTYLLRKVKLNGIPFLSPLPPVFFNALIIGAEISLSMSEGFSLTTFGIFALQVGLEELAVCYILGLPLYIAIERSEGRRLLER